MVKVLQDIQQSPIQHQGGGSSAHNSSESRIAISRCIVQLHRLVVHPAVLVEDQSLKKIVCGAGMLPVAAAHRSVPPFPRSLLSDGIGEGVLDDLWVVVRDHFSTRRLKLPEDADVENPLSVKTSTSSSPVRWVKTGS